MFGALQFIAAAKTMPNSATIAAAACKCNHKSPPQAQILIARFISMQTMQLTEHYFTAIHHQMSPMRITWYFEVKNNKS